MSKIAHICTSSISHKILADKLAVLQNAGHDVTLIASPEGYDEQYMRPYRFKLAFVPMNRKIHLLDDMRSILRMRKLLKRERFDIVHTHTAKAGLIGRIAARLAGVPVVVHTSHGLPFYEGQSKLTYTIYRSLERFGAWFSHALASQNEEDVRQLERLAPGKKVYYEGNGVDLDRLDAIRSLTGPKELTELRRQLGIAESAKVILVAARFEPVKDHAFLLEGLKLLKERGQAEFVCLLAGKGPLEAEIRHRIAMLGLEQEVRIIGHQSNIYPFIGMADLVALTSEKEGIPRVLMEAMAFGKPVVASDVLGTRELVGHEGTGLLVPYKAGDKLASALARMLGDEALRSRFGTAGREAVEACFTEQAVVRRLERMYAELAVGGAARKGALPWINRFVKRTVDLAAAVSALALLSPVLAVVALLVRLKLGAPVLFKQQRPGLHGKTFHVYKFRTMTDRRGPDGALLPDAERLTAFGKLLRKLSLDEIPQLLNVVRGDMSLVGPRPLLMEYLPLYTEEQARRHDVRPGITGWAQVNGRNAISWEQKFALDVWYVERQSFRLDLKILLMTVVKVFRREGVSQEGHVTMSKFTGSDGNVRGYS